MVIKKIKHKVANRLNNLIKQTNWWKNKFVFTRQFVSNAGYRKMFVRNLKVVNVGSNPARFAFFYEDVLGENWSTGPQGLNMDFEILKYRHSFLNESGYVLLPLVVFSSVSEYLNQKPEWRNYEYYLRYMEVLDNKQINNLPCALDVKGYYRSPLRYNRKAWKFLINDVEPDKRLEIVEQPMMLSDLINHADKTISGWKSEFDIKLLSTSLPEHLKKPMAESATIMRNMIDFLIERNITPVIVLPPITKVLFDKFPTSFWKTYIYDFIQMVDRPMVKVLDYTHNEKWQDSSLYFNSLFMNMRGRKLFTKQVLIDIGLL